MALNELNAFAEQSLLVSMEPKAPRAPYRKPELECLGTECTEIKVGTFPEGTFTSTPIS